MTKLNKVALNSHTGISADTIIGIDVFKLGRGGVLGQGKGSG